MSSTKNKKTSLKMKEGWTKIFPDVVIPTVPKTVRDAPIWIPASTYLYPIFMPFKGFY